MRASWCVHEEISGGAILYILPRYFYSELHKGRLGMLSSHSKLRGPVCTPPNPKMMIKILVNYNQAQLNQKHEI